MNRKNREPRRGTKYHERRSGREFPSCDEACPERSRRVSFVVDLKVSPVPSDRGPFILDTGGTQTAAWQLPRANCEQQITFVQGHTSKAIEQSERRRYHWSGFSGDPMKFTTVLALAVLLLGCASAYPQTATQSTQNHSAQTGTVTSQIDPAKEADIRHLLDLTGASSLMVQTMNDAETSIRPLFSNSLPPGEYREKLVDLFFEKFHSKRDPDQLLAIIIPFYDKY